MIYMFSKLEQMLPYYTKAWDFIYWNIISVVLYFLLFLEVGY